MTADEIRTDTISLIATDDSVVEISIAHLQDVIGQFLVDTPTAIERLGVSKQTFHNRRNAGTIRPALDGRGPYYWADDVTPDE